MKEPVYVDDYCCSVDILPTLLNLFGMKYDSRLLVGTDVFSDSTKMVILNDQIFITDKLMFNSSTGEATYFVDETTLEPDYLDTAIKAVKIKLPFLRSYSTPTIIGLFMKTPSLSNLAYCRKKQTK